MSDILIRGMEMPNTPVLFCIHPDGKVFSDLDGGWKEYLAVPVPPHGRLIDADALMRVFEREQRAMYDHGQEFSCSFLAGSQELATEWYCVEDMLENAETVIPASEVENND